MQLLIILGETTAPSILQKKHTLKKCKGMEFVVRIITWRKQSWCTALSGFVLHLFLKAKMKSKGIFYIFNCLMQGNVSMASGVAWISCNDFSGHQMTLCFSSGHLGAARLCCWDRRFVDGTWCTPQCKNFCWGCVASNGQREFQYFIHFLMWGLLRKEMRKPYSGGKLVFHCLFFFVVFTQTFKPGGRNA